MTTITTKLVKDGNSTAVRLSTDVLKMSGLNTGGTVQLSVQKGKITLRPLKAQAPRTGWEAQIAKVLSEDPHALDRDAELAEWEEATVGDGLDDIPWND